MPDRKREPLASTLPYALRDELYDRTPPLRMITGTITAVGTSRNVVTVDFGDGNPIEMPSWVGVTGAGVAQVNDLAYCLSFADSLICIAHRT